MRMIHATEQMLDELPEQFFVGDELEVKYTVGWQGSYSDGYAFLESVWYTDEGGTEWELDPDFLQEDERTAMEEEMGELARQDSYERHADYVYESMKEGNLYD